jgi:DNA-binding MarR family transcriptional regulator
MSARGPVPPPTGGTPQTQEQARAMVRSFLTDEQERIWFDLMETYAALLRALDARMLAEHNMPLSAFEALMHITHAEEGAISISDLAELVRLSPCQVSRIAIELERKGLVQRQRSATDSRSTEVAVTDAGRAQLQQAAPTYLSTIRSHLFEGLGEREVKQLARILERIQTTHPRTHR